MLEYVFNEIAGINSRLASLIKKSLHQRHLSLNILLFSFYEKVPSSFDHVAFFSKYFLPQPPVMFSTDFN